MGGQCSLSSEPFRKLPIKDPCKILYTDRCCCLVMAANMLNCYIAHQTWLFGFLSNALSPQLFCSVCWAASCQRFTTAAFFTECTLFGGGPMSLRVLFF